MGEGADGVTGAGKESVGKESVGKVSVGKVSREIESLRGELGGLVAELDRRRHDAFDLGLQARRHPVLLATIAGVAALAVGGLLALAVRTRRQRRRPSVRARETQRALARLLDHPERVASEPSVTNKVATAVVTLVATTLAKRMIDRKVAPPVDHDRRHVRH